MTLPKALTLALCALAFGLLGSRSVSAQNTPIVPVFPGWNLISAPAGTDLSAAGALYTLQPGDTGYEMVQPAAGTHPGLGYWAFFSNIRPITLTAGDNAPYRVTVAAGQPIQIGNPSGTEVASVSGADVVLAYDAVQGNYLPTRTLLPGQGAWAIANNGGVITVAPGRLTGGTS
ncbi:MAG: hypothetical protein ACR2PL_23965 [Dehalococcoidia bacterium]